jgi:DNA invertase Pin-like site-specific DNA recombinase
MGILGLRFLRTARKTGKNGGRPKAITMQKRSIAKELYDTGHPIMNICRTLKISRATLYRALKTADNNQQTAGVLEGHSAT